MNLLPSCYLVVTTIYRKLVCCLSPLRKLIVAVLEMLIAVDRSPRAGLRPTRADDGARADNLYVYLLYLLSIPKKSILFALGNGNVHRMVQDVQRDAWHKPETRSAHGYNIEE